MARAKGKCGSCGKTVYSDRTGSIITCGCYEKCQICGATMPPYLPDLAATTYGLDKRSDLSIIRACTLHSPSFLSTKKPIEVTCT